MDTPNAAPPNHARRFVRERLGCGCPDELLDRIEVDAMPRAALTELRVGGRLLVHIRPCPAPEDLPPLLAAWIGAGVALRDRLGFNRFRLVLLAPAPDDRRRSVDACFAALDADQRTHLHLLRPEDAGPLAPAR